MNIITMSDVATSASEAIRELRKLADFIEGISMVENAQVKVTGELNLEVRFVPQEEPVGEPA